MSIKASIPTRPLSEVPPASELAISEAHAQSGDQSIPARVVPGGEDFAGGRQRPDGVKRNAPQKLGIAGRLRRNDVQQAQLGEDFAVEEVCFRHGGVDKAGRDGSGHRR